MSIVFKEDKAGYFESLIETRNQEDLTIFRNFMYRQYAKYLQNEVENFEEIKKSGREKGNNYSLVF